MKKKSENVTDVGVGEGASANQGGWRFNKEKHEKPLRERIHRTVTLMSEDKSSDAPDVEKQRKLEFSLLFSLDGTSVYNRCH